MFAAGGNLCRSGPSAPETIGPFRVPQLPEMVAQAGFEVALIGRPHAGMADLRAGCHQPRLQPRLALGRIQRLGIALAPPEQLRKRNARVQLFGHRQPAAFADQVIRVHSIGQQHEEYRPARLDKRQRPVERAVSGAEAGPVAVETHHRLGPRPPDQLQLLLRQRRAKRGNGMTEARLAERDDIHIAFSHDQPAALAMAEGLARRLVTVQHVRLVEERRIAGIEVFRLGVGLQRPAAKGDDPAARVGDREHQPAAESVIGLPALVAFLDQAGFQQFSVGEAALMQMRPRAPPVIGRIAQPVPAPAGCRQAPALQIGARPRPFRRAQPLLEIGRRRLAGRLEAFAMVIFLDRLGGRLRQAHARLFRQFLDRFHEGEPFGLHHEADDIAAEPRREAFEDAFLVIDVEAGRLLIGEGRQADPFLALLGQLHLPANDIRRPDTGLQFFDKTIGNADR